MDMKNRDWLGELKVRYTDIDEIEGLIELNEWERAFFESLRDIPKTSYMPFSVTRYFFSLAVDNKCDAIRRQFMPSRAELLTGPYESSDPLMEEKYRVLPRLIHRYKNRVLILVTDACAVNCRFCFRRYYKSKAEVGNEEVGERGSIGEDELEAIGNYLVLHGEVSEVILSGGDPLVLVDGRLKSILNQIRFAREDVTIRVASRVLSVLPQRITKNLVALLSENRPIWFVSHFNHPAELTEEALSAISLLVEAGIPVVNQTVLLRGINDDTETLKHLFRRLVHNGVKPYYLFQGDLASGTSHFRVDLGKGLELVRELKRSLSGLEMPDYALDLPGGGGKVSLLSVPIERREDGYLVGDYSGGRHFYPGIDY